MAFYCVKCGNYSPLTFYETSPEDNRIWASCVFCRSYLPRKVDGALDAALKKKARKEVKRMKLRIQLADGGPIKTIDADPGEPLAALLQRAIRTFWPDGQVDRSQYTLAFNNRPANNLRQTIRSAGLKPEELVHLMPQRVESGSVR
jgi:hypothetical protein